jgi:hypothetical protein
MDIVDAIENGVTGLHFTRPESVHGHVRERSHTGGEAGMDETLATEIEEFTQAEDEGVASPV